MRTTGPAAAELGAIVRNTHKCLGAYYGAIKSTGDLVNEAIAFDNGKGNSCPFRFGAFNDPTTAVPGPISSRCALSTNGQLLRAMPSRFSPAQLFGANIQVATHKFSARGA